MGTTAAVRYTALPTGMQTVIVVCVSGNMVAVDDVDGMKSSVETYRTCTDKENSEPLYAKITKKKSARYNTESN